MYTSRPILAHEEIRTRQGMVVAQHPLGSEIGLKVLQRGGNAVDAAVSTAFAMGVLQPLMNGIGGGGLMTVYMAAGGGGAIDYGMQAPARATTDEYKGQGRNQHELMTRAYSEFLVENESADPTGVERVRPTTAPTHS